MYHGIGFLPTGLLSVVSSLSFEMALMVEATVWWFWCRREIWVYKMYTINNSKLLYFKFEYMYIYIYIYILRKSPNNTMQYYFITTGEDFVSISVRAWISNYCYYYYFIGVMNKLLFHFRFLINIYIIFHFTGESAVWKKISIEVLVLDVYYCKFVLSLYFFDLLNDRISKVF